MLYIVHLQKNCSLDSGVPLFWIFINIGIIMKAYICIELRWKVSKGPDKCLKFKEDVCGIADSWKQIIAVIDTAFTVAKRKPEFFSDFLFATAKVVSITEMIFCHIIFHSPVLIHDFSYIHNFGRFLIHPSLYFSNLSCSKCILLVVWSLQLYFSIFIKSILILFYAGKQSWVKCYLKSLI